MSKENEEKTAFYTDQGRNLEAYVDDMVIKSRTKRDIIMDVAKTFDNLRKVNMKLNPRKCSFGVKEGKFLRYMVTSEGIRANPKKMKANITKENKEDFRWTEAAEQAFQELKKLIMELSTLTTPSLKETLYVYLAASAEAISEVLMADRNGRQTPIRYVSRTLHEAEKNYAPLEKLTLCLLHLSQRASSLKGAGVGLVLIDPTGVEYTYAIRLNFASTNNKAEYEVLLAGLWIVEKIKVQELKVKVDSKLVACQMNGEFVANNDRIAKYLAKAKELSTSFKRFSIINVPRNLNQKADVLSKLASVAFNHLTKEILVEVLSAKSVEVQEMNAIVEEEEDNWMTLIIKSLEEGIWPKDENKARTLRIKINQYVMEGGILFKKSYLSPMLRDIIGHPCTGTPKKWWTDAIHARYTVWFGLPRVFVTDNRTQLVNDPFKSWCEKWKIKQMNTAVAHPQANGLVGRIHSLKARSGRERVGWVDKLPNILWAHRTMLKTSNGETPFSLIYRSEAVIPAEIGIPTYRTIQWNEAQNEEEMRLNLDLVQERRETAMIREAKYKKKVEQYYNKRVCPMSFKVGDFVYRRNEASRVENQGKLGPNWEGSYRVVEAYENGSYKLCTMTDREVPRTWHAINLQNYFM
ncbi:reverse transcriptase domain-containing protein [Tanacetum coccineum]